MIVCSKFYPHIPDQDLRQSSMTGMNSIRDTGHHTNQKQAKYTRNSQSLVEYRQLIQFLSAL